MLCSPYCCFSEGVDIRDLWGALSPGGAVNLRVGSTKEFTEEVTDGQMLPDDTVTKQISSMVSAGMFCIVTLTISWGL